MTMEEQSWSRFVVDGLCDLLLPSGSSFVLSDETNGYSFKLPLQAEIFIDLSLHDLYPPAQRLNRVTMMNEVTRFYEGVPGFVESFSQSGLDENLMTWIEIAGAAGYLNAQVAFKPFEWWVLAAGKLQSSQYLLLTANGKGVVSDVAIRRMFESFRVL